MTQVSTAATGNAGALPTRDHDLSRLRTILSTGSPLARQPSTRNPRTSGMVSIEIAVCPVIMAAIRR